MPSIALPITEFANPSPLSGSIEAYSGYGPLPNVGTELHQLVQEQRLRDNPEYQIERWTSHTFTLRDYKITVNGRLDGFWPGPPARIEEIKSAYNPQELAKVLQERADHPYRLQARTYAYLHYLQTGETPEILLNIISARNKKSELMLVPLDLEDYLNWLPRRLESVVQEMQMFTKLKKKRRRESEHLSFPFEHPRSGQMELMQTVEKNLDGKTALLLQAPTGLGKTVGVLYPLLREALKRGEKVLYLTPKNSQHAVAEDAVKRLQETGVKVRGQTLHAKAKLCLKEQVICNPEYCEFAKNHYDKVSEHGLIDKLSKKKNITFKTLQTFGRDYQVCPFEIQMAAIPRADVVICDYNYVFSPRSLVSRLTYNGGKSKPNLVIDEAHNLPTRAMDYFSARLSAEELRGLQRDLPGLTRDVQELATQLIQDSLVFIASAGSESDGRTPHRVQLDVDSVQGLAARAQEILARYLDSSAKLQTNDAVLSLANRWSEFSQAYANLSEEFFCSFTPSPQGGTVKITCCDAADWLVEAYADFQNVVAFSATVKPFDFYSRLLGFHKRTSTHAEFVSPFPKERRKLLIIPQVSTKYRDREANYGKIQEGIERIVSLHPGNYFVFFPSFEFLQRIASRLNIPGFQLRTQKREMRRDDITEILNALRQPNQPTVVLAVQGGVFSEGVDYPGETLIGAIVVGPALPTFDFEREMLRQYYAKKYNDENAFDYAYTYPAMAKVVQSAGRVIRSNTDRGLIVLMDRRFLEPSYVKSMPTDWIQENPAEHVSTQILQDIREFWQTQQANDAAK